MKQVQISEKKDYIVKLIVTLSFEVNILQKFDNLFTYTEFYYLCKVHIESYLSISKFMILAYGVSFGAECFALLRF